ncbi:MAG: SUMF1/EgtB/PvdO family nonheme iron enzyme, partial [Planctomycetota bacterium]|nr:SUMF1/EgtB/PvdO family nonheme iron enzyme [Planctomycetota bacterium]
MDNLPVNFVCYNDSLRFINWLSNGQPTGAIGNATTERGVYNMSLSKPVRGANAKVWLPSENEWFKAAYYKGGGANAGYWGFATRSDTAPAAGAPAGGANAANYQSATPAVGAPDYFNPVGAYTSTVSAYG